MQPTTYQNGVRSFFDAGMASDAPTTPIYWESSVNGPQLGGSTVVLPHPSPGDPPWVRVQLQTVSNPESSPGFTDHQGALIVQCFSSKSNVQAQEAEALAETVANICKRQGILSNFLEFGEIRVNEVGLDDAGNWYQINVRAQFQYIEAA